MFWFRQGELYSFEAMRKDRDEFLSLLSEQSIPVPPKSPIEHGLLLMDELLECHARSRPWYNWKTFAGDLQMALGVHHLVRMVLRRRDHEDFGKLVPHLGLLQSGQPALTVPACGTDQAADKLVELFVALACMYKGIEVELDDPSGSGNEPNPDVLATMGDGRRWGFACKVVHGDSPVTLFERFAEGVGQIDKSSADIGTVVISLKNRLPHEKFLPEWSDSIDGCPVYGCFPDPSVASEALRSFDTERLLAMANHAGMDEMAKLLSSSKALPGALMLDAVAIGVSTGSSSIPTFLGALHWVELAYSQLVLPSRFGSTEHQVLSDVNDGFNMSQRPSDRDFLIRL